MTNEALQALFTEFGERISAIVLDNKHIIYIGHPHSAVNTVDDIVLETKGGVDMIGVPHNPSKPKEKEKGVQFMFWHPTEMVQCIIAVDEDHPNVLIDPFDLF